MTQKTNPRLVIDTNRHGIRREINLDSEYKKTLKRKEYEAKSKPWKKKNKLSTDNKKLSTDIGQ